MPAPSDTLEVLDWGLIDYRQALQQQEELVEKVHTSKKGVLVVCSHPPVVTLGRRTTPEDLRGWTGDTVQVSRGGKATYHGPSQLVIYPILPIRDIPGYLRNLEKAIVRAVAHFDVKAMTSVEHAPSLADDINNTGVWVGPQKLASIGIAVRRWISFHGLALNVDHDPEAFKGINPCGFSQGTMTSLEKILGKPVDRETLKALLIRELQRVLN